MHGKGKKNSQSSRQNGPLGDYRRGRPLCVYQFRNVEETRQKEAIVRENRTKIETRTREIKETGAAIRNSDSLEFAEKVAREDLGMVKPREVIYVDKEKDRTKSINEEDTR